MVNRSRQSNLVANFVNGYAQSWHMAVKDCYRNELDIKYTERKKNKQSSWEWTQGPYFAFSEGHLFYDTPEAYGTWGNAIKYIKIACQITSATPTILNKNKNLIEGTVKFILFQTDKECKSLKAIGDHVMSQKEFVNFLKTGELNK